ncbi:MAG: hypothetical protein U0795_07135 [Pirellulales bacterium]
MNQSSQSRIDQIEAWFLAHQDGEFAVTSSVSSSIRTGDASIARTIVYTTKHQCLPRLRALPELPGPIATLSRYGLPVVDDLPFVRGATPDRIFFGDCDPPDLLAFAWLREHFPIVWRGVNDGFLQQRGHRSAGRFCLQLSDSELQSVSILPQLCPDYRTLLGEYCSSVIDQGFKIELEGALFEENITKLTG